MSAVEKSLPYTLTDSIVNLQPHNFAPSPRFVASHIYLHVYIFTYFTRLARVLYLLSISKRKRAAAMLLSYILEKKYPHEVAYVSKLYFRTSLQGPVFPQEALV